MIGAYIGRRVVGAYFEKRFAKELDLIRNDRKQTGLKLDLISQDRLFGMEVKGSAFDNGGVIRGRQLTRNLEYTIDIYYAFGYHSLSCNLGKGVGKFNSAQYLRRKLDVRGLYSFPIEIISAFFNKRDKIYFKDKKDHFVQLRESAAKNILSGEEKMWDKLDMDYHDFKHSMINNVNQLERVFEVPF